jgi:hypothetical protein
MSLRAIAWQSLRVYVREEIASSFLLAMTYFLFFYKNKKAPANCPGLSYLKNEHNYYLISRRYNSWTNRT